MNKEIHCYLIFVSLTPIRKLSGLVFVRVSFQYCFGNPYKHLHRRQLRYSTVYLGINFSEQKKTASSAVNY